MPTPLKLGLTGTTKGETVKLTSTGDENGSGVNDVTLGGHSAGRSPTQLSHYKSSLLSSPSTLNNPSQLKSNPISLPSESPSSSNTDNSSNNVQSPLYDIQNSEPPVFEEKLFHITHQALDHQSHQSHQSHHGNHLQHLLKPSSPPSYPPYSASHHNPENPSFSSCFQFPSSSSPQNDSKTSKDVKKRSSKACDNCRKSKCKCTRAPDPDGVIPSTKPCQNCLSHCLECTFNGASRKRGPPKGYIEAIESRLHRMEAFLGALLGNDDPRARALFFELVGDNEVVEILQNNLKLSAQSANKAESTEPSKVPDVSMLNNTSLHHHTKSELTDTQKAIWGVHLDQFAGSKEHHPEDSNKLGATSSDPDDDCECENGLADRSSIPNNKHDHHRIRRRRLGSHLPSYLPGQSKLSIPTFNHASSKVIIPHTATAALTPTQPESLNPSQDFCRLGDDNALQIPKPDALTIKQHSPATLSELADVVGQLSLDENDEVRYHGRSSGLYLISASQRYKNFFWQFPKPGFWPVAPIRPSDSILDMFALVNPLEVFPDREMMNHLLDLYWAFVHPIMPVLYKSEFLTQFQHLLNNLDKIRQARPHWTVNQVWCHALSGTSSSSNASPSDSSYHHPPSTSFSEPEPRVSGLEPTNRISMLLLLVIFAISSRYSTRSSSPSIGGQNWNAGDKYFEKAKQILNLDYGNSKLTSCQSLILMAYREIGSGATGESWLYTGMAIRMAQDMGLFRDVDKWFMPVKRFTHEEKQIRKRVWWACVNMDKYVSTYIGRPMMIFERDYDTAFPSTDEPDEHEQWTGWSRDGQIIELSRPETQKLDSAMTAAPEDDKELTEEKKDATILDHQPIASARFAKSAQGKSYTISCFSRSASLSVLISRIVANIYAIRIRVISQSSETLLSLLDQNLARWYLDLPEHLQYNPQPIPLTPEKSSSAGLESPKRALTPHLLTLHAQFYTALILLHRPFIPASNPQVNLSNPAADCSPCSPSHSICTTAANAITSIAQAYSQAFDLRQAPVFLVYYIFTAAILHVYNASSDAGLALTAKVNLLKCMDSLKEMAPTWTGAVRAWELLVGLVDFRDHDQLDNQQQQSSKTQPNTSNFDSHGLQKLHLPGDRGLKRPASASDTEDQMKHSFFDIKNPHTSSLKSNTGNTKSFRPPFDHSQLNLDWMANQELVQSKPGAPYERVKLVRSASDSDRSVNVDSNAVKQMNTITTQSTAREHDVDLLQSRSLDSEVKISNESSLRVCDKKDLSGFDIETSKYQAAAGSSRVPSSHKNDEIPVGLNYRPDCEFLQGGADKQYFSRQAAMPTTALEEMMGLMDSSVHLYDHYHQPSLQTLVPPPAQSQLQPWQEQQHFQSHMNQELSPLTFDLNSFTPSPTSAHHPYGALNDPEISNTTIQGVFGRSAPQQLGKSAEERLQQNRLFCRNPNQGREKIEGERERQYHQERIRTESSMVLKDSMSLDEALSDFGLNWAASRVDPVGGYGIDPSSPIFVNPHSHLSPQTIDPHHPTHPTHPLHSYHNYNTIRNHPAKGYNVNTNSGAINS